MARPGETRDWWAQRLPALYADGWVLYVIETYDPIVMRGYTPTVLPSGMANNPTNRRRLNRPFWCRLARTTGSPLDPWQGVLRFAATSSLNPWAVGFAPPFPLLTNPDGSKVADIPEAAWRIGTDGHYVTAEQQNPVVGTELDAARDAPTVTLAKNYTNLWQLGDDGTWQTGAPDTLQMFNAVKDLFASIAV